MEQGDGYMRTWLMRLASGHSTSIGWEESFASRDSARDKCWLMNCDVSFHSGKTLSVMMTSPICQVVQSALQLLALKAGNIDAQG